MARLGVTPAIIERVLNHVSGVNGALVGIYQRSESLPERKAALDAWGPYVRELTTARSETSDQLLLAPSPASGPRPATPIIADNSPYRQSLAALGSAVVT